MRDVRDLHRLLTLLLTDLVVQPSADVRAEAELAGLQDDDADLAGLGLLLLDLVLKEVLGGVELEGLNRSLLCSDRQRVGRVVTEVVPEFPPNVQ